MSEITPGEPPDVPLGDVLGDVPLFREIKRVLLSSTGPINWELARQVGITMASFGAADDPPTEEDRRGLAETVRAAELAVADFTGLSAPSDPTEVQAFRRAQWVEANIGGLRALLEPVAGRLTSAMAQAQGETLPFAVGEGAGPPNDMVEMLLQRAAVCRRAGVPRALLEQQIFRRDRVAPR